MRKCALELEDTALLAKLAAGDILPLRQSTTTTVCVLYTTELGKLHPKMMCSIVGSTHGMLIHQPPAHHRHSQETPLPLYLSLKIHVATRSRGLVDTLFNLGLCVSYDRLLQLSADIANGVCQRFRMEGVVCPPKLRHGLLTTGIVDNIDHNPSSTTTKDSFHGTGVSLVQHPSHTDGGTDRGILVTSQSGSSSKSGPRISVCQFYKLP